MTLTADLEFTVISEKDVYTNSLTPVTAVPWPDRHTDIVLPYATTKFSNEHMIWDFGDGTTYTGVSAVHTYSWPGDYTVKLTIINEDGQPVESTKSHNLIVKDFILTQLGFRDLLDVIDIPSGRLVSPITIDFTLSWQNYSYPSREAPQCIDGMQHLMNKGTAPGYWMCGKNHPGYETAQQPEVTDFPIYTFNLHASGASTGPLNLYEYEKNKYGHLELNWSFHNASPALTSQPVNDIQVTRTDFITGSSGDPNTYDLIYYKKAEANEYIQTTANDPQGVFVGLSGNASFYYRDDVTKCTTSRDTSVLISVEMDEKKLFDQLTIGKQNNTDVKYINNKPLIINNIKPRVNEAVQLGVTTIGIPGFEIGENKWEDSVINFTVTVQDAFEFNILDSKTLSGNGPLTGTAEDLKLELVDSITNEPITGANYTFTQVESNLGSYRGQLRYSGERSNVKIRASTTYEQISGYKTDAIAPWLNTYRPEKIGTGTPENPELPETGSLYRYYYPDVIQYNSNQLYDNFTLTLTGSSLYIDTNGVISDVIMIHPGENITQPPRVTVEDTTGDGASLVPRFNIDGGIVSDIIVITGGRGYSSSPVIYFTLADANATVPNAQAVVDNNYNVEIIAVQPPDPGIIEAKTWALETGRIGDADRPPRIVEATTRAGLTRSRSLSAITTSPSTPVDIKLDNNGDIYLATLNKVVQISNSDLELSNIYDDNSGGYGNFTYINDNTYPICLEVDYVNVYLGNKTNVNKINKVNTEHRGKTILSHNLQHMLLHYNNNMYILTDQPGIVVVDVDTMSIKSTIKLPTGSYTNITTTVNSKLYFVRDGRYLMEFDENTYEIHNLYDFAEHANIITIAGDSRGTIWLPDDGNRKLWAVDVIDNITYDENSIPGDFKYGMVNYSTYPTPPDGDSTGHVLRAKGDFTGFHWLQKFGIIRPGPRKLIGYSNSFNIHSRHGTYNLMKNNENHNQAITLKSYATQPWLNDNHNLWDQMMGTVVGDDKSEPMGLGKQVFERISNFTGNNTDIDDCTIDNIHNHSLMYDMDIQSYNLNYPPTLKRILDLCSIKHCRLFGTFDYATEHYDMYTGYTDPDNRENLGRELDIHTAILLPGEKIVAYERFSKNYTTITVTTPTTGNFDEYGNMVNVGEDTTLVNESNKGYPLSAYNVFWQWELIAPTTVKGIDIIDYYAFYSRNETTNAKQVEGVIDWENDQTLLSPELSAYNAWEQTYGILDNLIEHQLRTGLNLFTETVTGDIDGDGINNYYDSVTAITGQS